MSKPKLLEAICASLDSAGHRYCIVHGYQNFHNAIESDVDMILDKAVSLPTFIECVETTGVTLIQYIQHESSGHYLVFVNLPFLEFIHLDISYDYRRNGVVFYDGKEFLDRRVQSSYFWTSCPSLEFGYYLAKKIAKRDLSRDHERRLSELFSLDPNGCSEQIKRLLGVSNWSAVRDAAHNNDWNSIRSQMKHLRRQLLLTASRKSPFGALKSLTSEIIRCVSRVRHPTGLHVAFFGPDGSGKSSVVGNVSVDLSPSFRHVVHQHLFPGRKKEGAGVPEPHGKALRGSVRSIAQMGLWGIRYSVGYIFHIWLPLIKSTLVLSDRYYPDILVDPLRYRYGGPSWITRTMWKVLPSPDICVLLDAPAKVLQERKHEVAIEETARQLYRYRSLFDALENGYIINASLSLDEVVTQADQVILHYMMHRTHRRLKIGRNPNG